jgi:predicted MFS family arabinose efflux permease
MLSQLNWRRGSIVILFSFIAALATSPGQTFLVSLFVSPMSRDLQISPADLAWLYGIATLAGAIFLPWLGRQVDSIDLLKMGALASAFLLSGCVVASIATSSLSILVSYFLLRLAGPGLLSHISASGVARYFHRERGVALALAALGFAVGEGLLPLLTSESIGAIGWRSTFAALGFAMWLAFILAAYFVRGRTRLRYPRSKDAKIPMPVAPNNVRRDPAFWCIVLCLAIPAGTETALLFHQSTLARFSNLSPIVFAQGFLVYAVVQIPSSIVGGKLIDRHGSTIALLTHSLPMLIGIGLLGFCQTPWTVWVFLAGLSMTAAVNSLLRTTSLAERYGSERVGTTRSLLSTTIVAFNALSPPLLGMFLAFCSSMPKILLTCGGALIAAVVALTPIFQRPHVKEKFEG